MFNTVYWMDKTFYFEQMLNERLIEKIRDNCNAVEKIRRVAPSTEAPTYFRTASIQERNLTSLQFERTWVDIKKNVLKMALVRVSKSPQHFPYSIQWFSNKTNWPKLSPTLTLPSNMTHCMNTTFQTGSFFSESMKYQECRWYSPRSPRIETSDHFTKCF